MLSMLTSGDLFCYGIILSCTVAGAVILVRALTPEPYHWEEAISHEIRHGQQPLSIETTFQTIQIGDQFQIDADPGGWTFERIPLTTGGMNARCDVYDTFVHADEAVTLVSVPMRR